MKCIIVSPTRLDLILEKEDPKDLQQFLSYENKSISYELSRLDSNYEWMIRKIGTKGYYQKREELLREETKTLLFKDAKVYWTYLGMLPRLIEKYHPQVYGAVEYPHKKTLLWHQWWRKR
jgi:hypothetical protein